MDDLIALARQVQSRAYAPYSNYQVGAALRTVNGTTFVGVNFENISYGATICAERGAIGAMVAAGERQIQEIVVITRDGVTPCGICRAVIAEFSTPQTQIMCLNEAGEANVYSMSELYPFGFQSELVKKSENE